MKPRLLLLLSLVLVETLIWKLDVLDSAVATRIVSSFLRCERCVRCEEEEDEAFRGSVAR